MTSLRERQTSGHAEQFVPSPNDRNALALLWGYVLLKPFYFWSSGLPQVADIFLIAAMAAYSIPRLNRFQHRGIQDPHVVPLLASFAAYATSVNIFTMLVTGSDDTGFLIASSFHLYNIGAAVLVASLHATHGYRLRRILFHATITSVLLQSALVFIGSRSATSPFRETGQFNNPNQLAYFGLISATIILFVFLVDRGPTLLPILGVLAAIWLVLESLSKAGILSAVVLLILLPVALAYESGSPGELHRKRVAVAVLTAAVAATVLTFWEHIQRSDLGQKLETRFGILQQDDGLDGRGYDRIWDNPQYWLFGSGEGDYNRFGDGHPIELHSTIGSIVSSYGLIGVALFMAILLLAIRKSGPIGLYLLIPIMMYGLTHNGTRNTLFWALLSVLLTATFRTTRREGATPANRKDQVVETLR